MLFRSPVYSEARGSIAGLTYSRNAAGLIVRARVTPVNPNTAAQQAIRAGFSSTVAAYNALSQANKDSWQVYGETRSWTNKLGDPIHLSALPAFLAVNTLREQAGLALLSTAPALTLPYGVDITPLAADYSWATGVADPQITATISNSPAWCASANSRCMVFVGRPQSPGRATPIGGYQLAGTIAGNATPIVTMDVTNPFGGPALGQIVHMKMIVLSTTTAPSSPLFMPSLAAT